MKPHSLLAPALFACLALGLATDAEAQYTQRNLISNDPKYDPQVLDPTFGDTWGIAIRPAGLGGHFWFTNKNTGVSTEYLGDVNGVPIHQDSLTTVTIPPPAGAPAGTVAQPTGVVFNGSGDFAITLPDAPNAPIVAASKFLFATNDGTIAAWTERQRADGGYDRPADSVLVVDHSARGDNFFGLAVTTHATGNLLYAANFGLNPGIETFDSAFHDVSGSHAFANPFASQGYQPFNVQDLGGSVFVTYAQYGSPGTEVHGAGLGRLAQFDEAGNLVTTWDDRGLLDSPWGLAIAPASFGKYAGDLIVGNFGDIDEGIGSLVAFDPVTHRAIDYLRDAAGNPLLIPGVWGLTFGNGASLGEADSLYFAAGPNDEKDGVVGKVRAVPEPASALLILTGLGLMARRRRRRPAD